MSNLEPCMTIYAIFSIFLPKDYIAADIGLAIFQHILFPEYKLRLSRSYSSLLSESHPSHL